MFGQIKLEQFTGITTMPQKAASAWSGAFPPDFVGVSFKPLLYLGEQVVNGTLYWFIAERTMPYRYEIRHVVKMAILEQGGEYKFLEESISEIA